ncbi:hypothetical protein BTH55_05165 [Lactobacillus delbrueckii subsp. bulgaricus]|nr:hypothetical protein [Lactobacillus delbrueckii subsp. bulgaricus]MBT8854134.1 hypothetical protein [Lactobacillus delbrueckii subsp. bulgaricus]MBT8857209.1 hypothetical protein [Lactobacillus delbrueckii subsp. bulgaricus]MBT8866955.1 hypothetical protein [Lactobacillus delbrueckii subsp. bulgaricus]
MKELHLADIADYLFMSESQLSKLMRRNSSSMFNEVMEICASNLLFGKKQFKQRKMNDYGD